MMRASSPSATTRRAQWWAMALASIATIQSGGSCRAPGHKLGARERPGNYAPTGGINGMHLDDLLGEIDANTCNLIHGISPSRSLQIDFLNDSILALDAIAKYKARSLFIFIAADRLRRRLNSFVGRSMLN